MRRISFRSGDTIISEGDVGDTAYLITAGTVEVMVGEGASAKSVVVLGEGEVFGEMSLIDNQPRSATVKASSETECVATTYDELMSSFQDHPVWALTFMKTFARRLRHMNELMTKIQPSRETEADYQKRLAAEMADFRERE